ncbi:hypothetical protein PPACK8108_LOCUS5526 [Phakopsora pachyrhizi]|uniref:Secreted protein n=1 Tax=Phakopsora pachyrhizi TaxID=170000 RepID=A0AAV0ARW1_PHAPC|nr:hypothetical protein PPACK8108_LOCUS5526 [Phakopsora pachyrhizi]
MVTSFFLVTIVACASTVPPGFQCMTWVCQPVQVHLIGSTPNSYSESLSPQLLLYLIIFNSTAFKTLLYLFLYQPTNPSSSHRSDSTNHRSLQDTSQSVCKSLD